MDLTPLLAILRSKKAYKPIQLIRLQRWRTILFNYNFSMEFLPASKLHHADGLSRLIPQNSESLEDTVIVTLQA